MNLLRAFDPALFDRLAYDELEQEKDWPGGLLSGDFPYQKDGRRLSYRTINSNPIKKNYRGRDVLK